MIIGIPGTPATIYAGPHTVGPEPQAGEIAKPGTYIVRDVENCYWERLSDTGEIIDNNFVTAAPRVEVAIRESDYAFNSDDCGRWVQIDFS